MHINLHQCDAISLYFPRRRMSGGGVFVFVFVLYLRCCFVVVNDALRSRKEISACFCLLELRLRSFLVCWRPSTFVSRIFLSMNPSRSLCAGYCTGPLPPCKIIILTGRCQPHQPTSINPHPNNTPVPPRSSTPNTTSDPTLRLHGGSRLELGARLLVPLPGRPPN